MDRELSQRIKNKRKRKRILSISTSILFFLSLLVIVPSFVRPTIETTALKLSVVDNGAVESSILTYGSVEPFYQEIVTSPIQSDVIKIYFLPGDTVTPDDTIFQLDISELMNKQKLLINEYKMALNAAKRKKEEIKQELSKLKTGLISDSLKVIRLKSVYEMEKKLLDLGGGIKENVEQAELEFQLQKLKLTEVKRTLGVFDKLSELDLESINLQAEQKMNALEETNALISKAYVRPKINGVITLINAKPGQTVNSGEQLGIIADLSSYKVRGTISDKNIGKIFTGQTAKIYISKEELNGKIMSISPGVDNGAVAFDVFLSNPNLKILKPRLKTEIRLIESISPKTLRIKNSDFYIGEGFTEVFVIEGNYLMKRKVKLGGCSYDYIEVIEGLHEGEEVVINASFYKNYESYNKLKIKN